MCLYIPRTKQTDVEDRCSSGAPRELVYDSIKPPLGNPAVQLQGMNAMRVRANNDNVMQVGVASAYTGNPRDPQRDRGARGSVQVLRAGAARVQEPASRPPARTLPRRHNRSHRQRKKGERRQDGKHAVGTRCIFYRVDISFGSGNILITERKLHDLDSSLPF